MSQVTIEVEGLDDFVQLLELQSGRLEASPREVFAAVGEDWVSRFQANVREGGTPTVALSPTTIALRALEAGPGRRQPRYGGGGGASPLFRTGGLKDSLSVLSVSDETIEVGTTREGASLLHFGGTTSPASMIPGRPVPARPFVVLAPEDIELTFESLYDFYFGEAVAA